MRSFKSYAGVLLLAACAHGSPSQEPAPSEPTSPAPARPVREPSADLGTLQPSSTAVEARHEPGPPDPEVSVGAPTPAPTSAESSSSAVQAASAPADTPQLSREESALRERIQRRLLQEKSLSYTAQRVRLQVQDKDVTVQGEVRTAREKREVEQLIESITGVRRVHNQLAVINQTNPDLPSGLQTR